MKKGVLFTFAITLGVAAAPTVAHAEKKFDVTATVANVYAFPDQAMVISHNPVGNVNIDYTLNEHATLTVWAQGGDYDGTEIDLIGSVHTNAGRVSLSAMGGVYLYPNGQATIYTAAASASAPVAGFTLRANAQRYWGGLETTKLQVEASHPVKIGPVTADLMIGKAWNTQELHGVNPWYGSVSVPVNGHLSVKAAGYVQQGNKGGVVSMSYRF